MLLDGCRGPSSTAGGAGSAARGVTTATTTTTEVVYEDQAYLHSQSGTMRLDKFTHCLLVKCSVEVRAGE